MLVMDEKKTQPVNIKDVPKELREKAAKQYLYNQLVSEGSPVEHTKELYDMIQNFDIEEYIEPVFTKHDEVSKYIMSLELTNLLNSRGYIAYTQEGIESILG